MAAEPQASQDQWEDVGGGTLVKWDEAKTVEGIYQGSVEVEGQFGKQKKHTLLADDGQPLEFYAPAILQRKLEDPRVKVGGRIRIVFENTTTKTKSGRQAKDFIVQVAG